MEAKKNELEKEEERILKDAASRLHRKSTGTPTSDEFPAAPPPLPQAPPPGPGSSAAAVDPLEPSGAAQRLDALISTNLKTNGHHPQASKKVSFASSAEPLDESPEIEMTPENNEKLSRLDKYEKDPNVSQQLFPQTQI